MCDYSLHNVASRPAKVGDELLDLRGRGLWRQAGDCFATRYEIERHINRLNPLYGLLSRQRA